MDNLNLYLNLIYRLEFKFSITKIHNIKIRLLRKARDAKLNQINILKISFHFHIKKKGETNRLMI